MDFLLSDSVFPLLLPNFIWCKAAQIETSRTPSRSDFRFWQSQAGLVCAAQLLDEMGDGLKLHHKNPVQKKWPDTVVGSITHKQNQVYVVVAKKTDVVGLGVDCEIIFQTARADRLAERILTNVEKQFWPRSGLSWPEFVSVIFSMKESAYKALSCEEQKRIGFRSLMVEWDQAQTGLGRAKVAVIETGEQSGCKTKLVADFWVGAGRVLTCVVRPLVKQR